MTKHSSQDRKIGTIDFLGAGVVALGLMCLPGIIFEPPVSGWVEIAPWVLFSLAVGLFAWRTYLKTIPPGD